MHLVHLINNALKQLDSIFSKAARQLPIDKPFLLLIDLDAYNAKDKEPYKTLKDKISVSSRTMTQNYDDFIKAMQEFCNPEAAEKRLRDKWSKAGDIVAIHIHYAEPEPDGTYEILFAFNDEAKKLTKTVQSPGDKIDVISFESGVLLAKQEECCGGTHSIEEAKIIASVNPYIRSLGIELNSIF